jgi:Protein of unknown function (DUF4230)
VILSSEKQQHPIVLSQVQTLSDLVTVKYVTEQIVQLEDGNILSKDRIVLIAHGVIKAGIDLNKVTAEDLAISGKTISIHLPPPQVVDKYLDEKLTEVSLRETGWFVFHRKDLETEARQKALAGLVTAARVGGIDKEAELHAKTMFPSDRTFCRPTSGQLQSIRSTLVEPITVTPLFSELLPITVVPSEVEAK